MIITEGVQQNWQEDLKWYKLAAAQEYAESQKNIGELYWLGESVMHDYKEASKVAFISASLVVVVGSTILYCNKLGSPFCQNTAQIERNLST